MGMFLHYQQTCSITNKIYIYIICCFLLICMFTFANIFPLFWKFCRFCNATFVSRLCLGNVWSCFVGAVWTGISSLVYELMEELSKFIPVGSENFLPVYLPIVCIYLLWRGDGATQFAARDILIYLNARRWFAEIWRAPIRSPWTSFPPQGGRVSYRKVIMPA